MLAATRTRPTAARYIASPTMPWAWGTRRSSNPPAPYHLVWSRDLYQIATALIAAGDTRRRRPRASTTCSTRQQKPDGSFPQNSTRRRHAALEQPAARRGRAARSCWPGSSAAPTARLPGDHVKRAADFLVSSPGAPFTPQERWENQSGYSPAHDRARRSPAWSAPPTSPAAQRRRRLGGALQRDGRRLAAARPGLDGHDERPVLAASRYYLRLTKDGNAERGHDVHASATAARRSTSARSSTRASSSSCGSA